MRNAFTRGTYNRSMNDAPLPHRIYRLTSIGRPLDPSWPSNRAVIILAPLAGLVFAGWRFLQGTPIDEALMAGVYALLTAFLSWALARELAPDDQPAAFIAMALALSTLLNIPDPGLFLLVVALALTRVVNRSTGLAPTVVDSTLVTLAVLGLLYTERAPLVGLIGAFAFALDAALPGGHRRQWGFAAACVLGGIAALVAWGPGVGGGAPLSTHGLLLPGLFGLLFLGALLATRRLDSVTDVGGEPLSVRRVRGAMWIALLLAAHNLAEGLPGARDGVALWAVLGGVGIGRLWTLALRR